MPEEPEAPTDVITRMSLGFRETQALYVAAKLGVADLLVDGPEDAGKLAAKLEVKPDPLFRLMRALASLGVFTQDASDRFGLTPVSQLLRTDVPDSMRYTAIFTGEEHYRAAGELLHTVKTGETAFRHLYGMGHFEYLAKNDEASKTFNMFMAQSIRRAGEPINSFDFSGRRLVVDVGGGKGTMVAKVLRGHPGMKGVLFDLPQGVAEARGYLKEQGVDGRCQIVSGSFFESVPAGGDVYLLSRILHDWPDEEARKILTNCRRAIGEKGTLVIIDAVLPDGDAPSPSKLRDLSMLFLLNGKERSESEWDKLLRGTGFEPKRFVKSGRSLDLIEAGPV